MLKINLSDTIAALATPVGESGIGIVRISGRDVFEIADKIFVSKDNKKPSVFKAYTTHYGWIVDSPPESKKPQALGSRPSAGIVDEVILTVMRAPRSYTKEDIVEINCHGGIVALRNVLALVLESGCRLAEPGEFTRRAFLNGRIDLAQAEAVLDIIRAKTDFALKMGVEQLKGSLSMQINGIRKALLDILSLLEANIDFPEEEIGPASLEDIAGKLESVNKELKGLLDGAKSARLFREGILVVICGKPNVGKSSLLNALLKRERSIVTSVAGTTRDTIEEIIDIKGIPVRIVDTAGIIRPRDLIERKAVERSKRYIELADLVVLLFDGSKRLTAQDEAVIVKLKKKKVIAAINKIDLRQKIERGRVLERLGPAVDISAKKFQNINLLEERIADLVYNGSISAGEAVMVSNLRHILAIKEAGKFISSAMNSIGNNLSLEFIAVDIKEALSYLDDILGKSFSEDLLERIFSNFCIGK